MTETESRSPTRTDWLLIGLLVALVLPLRLWLLHNTEVTARDSIGYIRYALQFDKKPWQQVCATNHQHPGYPVLVWLMAHPVSAIAGETTPESMQLSAQLVSLTASLLLLVPMYFLGRQFFDRTISFGAALLYQYLPISAHHLSDGISEPAFLVLLTASLLQAVHAVRDRSVWRCALCGLLAGASYVVRPEGLLVVPAFAGVMIAMQFRPDWRCPWKRFAGCTAATMLAVALSGSVYVIATGNISNKPTANRIIRNLLRLDVDPLPEPAAGAHGAPALFAVTFQRIDNKLILFWRSSLALGAEISQGFHYVGIVPAILGFCWSFAGLRRDPGYWLMLTFAGVHSFILVSLAMSVYYVSDRHVMILVIGGSYFAVFGLRELAQRAAGLVPSVPTARATALGFALLYVVLIACCLPKATQRLHGNRAGNHAAGLWLSEQLREGDMIEDDHGWTHFFSGFVLKEGNNPRLPADAHPRCFVVATTSNDPLVNDQRHKIAAAAEVVYTWPKRADVRTARVVIYQQPRDFARNPWRKAE